jgi:hypothetical protein
MQLVREVSNVFLFSIMTIILLAITYIYNEFLISDSTYYNTFAEQLSSVRIEEIIEQNKKLRWLSYCLIPIIYFFKFSIVTLALYIGFFFSNRETKLSHLFKSVLLSEFIFLFVPIIKVIWFLSQNNSYDLKDLQSYYPLSALLLFDLSTLDAWQIYPLQLFNVFELIYWLLLANCLKYFFDISLTQGMKIVLNSYVLGLFLWIFFVIFLLV